MTLFQIGEKIVYPNHGIGTVENISSRSFGAQFERYYLLRLTYQQHDGAWFRFRMSRRSDSGK